MSEISNLINELRTELRHHMSPTEGMVKGIKKILAKYAKVEKERKAKMDAYIEDLKRWENRSAEDRWYEDMGRQ